MPYYVNFLILVIAIDSGTHVDCEWLIGKGLTLDPTKYFIILTNAFGNGLSSSPSNQPEPYNGPRFPNVTLYGNKSGLETITIT